MSGPNEKPPEIKKREYLERFNHRIVKIKLVNGKELSGKLHTNKESRYEVLLEIEEGNKILIYKHAIISIEAQD